MDNITEIRIEEVKDYENNDFYYYIYCIKDTGERIEVGKSKPSLNVINKFQLLINPSC